MLLGTAASEAARVVTRAAPVLALVEARDVLPRTLAAAIDVPAASFHSGFAVCVWACHAARSCFDAVNCGFAPIVTPDMASALSTASLIHHPLYVVSAQTAATARQQLLAGRVEYRRRACMTRSAFWLARCMRHLILPPNFDSRAGT